MTPIEIYQQIHLAIVNFWTMFVPVPTDAFTIILYNLVIYGTQFFIGFLFFWVPWKIFKIFWGC